jgi:hypothetical protein
MADKKISALTAATTPLAGTEVLPIVQSGSTVKVSVENLTLGRAVNSAGGTFTDNFIQGTAGKGIDFSANTPAAGMTSELLNWYEEGTWTPTSTTLTFVGSPTYTGHYVRQGRIVYVTLRIQATSITSSGAIISLGFPFVSANILTTVPVSNVANNASLGAGFITVSGGNTIIYLPNFSALTDVMFTGFYFV